MDFRVQLQVDEALGSLNRWFCSEAFGHKIDDPELLVIYYIKSGGAADFARRYCDAMGLLNRWYCSEYYGRDIREAQILWHYYTNLAPVRAMGKNPRIERDVAPVKIGIAC